MTTSTGDCLLSTFKIPLLDGYLHNLLFQSELRRWGFAVAAMPAVLFLKPRYELLEIGSAGFVGR